MSDEQIIKWAWNWGGFRYGLTVEKVIHWNQPLFRVAIPSKQQAMDLLSGEAYPIPKKLDIEEIKPTSQPCYHGGFRLGYGARSKTLVVFE